MTGYSIMFIWDWRIDRLDIRNKTVFALGPFRFCIHRKLGWFNDPKYHTHST